MSHTFNFTLSGSQEQCLFWQSKFSDFLSSARTPLPAEVDMNIKAKGGAGAARPQDGGYVAPTYSAAPMATYAAAPPMATYAAAPPMATYAAAPPAAGPRGAGGNATIRPTRAPMEGGAVGVTPKITNMLEQVRQSIRKHGAVGIRGIGRKFRICDDDGSKQLDVEEFTKAMRELGFNYSPAEVEMLMNSFDTSGDMKIDYEEFLTAVRPPMSLKRKRIVQKVFEMIDTDKSGVLTAVDLKSRFNPAGDPRVSQREKSASAVAEEFLSTFDVFDHDGNVGPDEFLKYYQGVSASIDDDSYFELMMRNAWHMSGGTGQSQNTTCLRILVIHQDGSQTVEELKNDLGLDKTNRKDIFERLQQQGCTDAVDVKLYG